MMYIKNSYLTLKKIEQSLRICAKTAFFTVFLLNINLSAQENATDVGKTLEELQKNQQEIRIELQEIKSLLSKLTSQPH